MASVLRHSLWLSTVFAGSLSARSLRNLRFNRTNPIHTGRMAFGVQYAELEAAKERSTALKEDPGTIAKLQMYALYKQATEGSCSKPEPSDAFDLMGRAKWQAWSSLGNISQNEAQRQYIDLINYLGRAKAPVETEDAAEDASRFKDIKVTKENKVYTILLDRPSKGNALSLLMYDEIIQALDQARKDDSVTVAVITGAGDCFTSGLDLDVIMNTHPKDFQKMARIGREYIHRFVAAFIDFPKPLIAAVNGLALGYGASTLGLCDAVYASDRAVFHWPFTELGGAAEGCSSYVFPKVMGNTKANEVLLFNKKLTAHEACERGLVTEVFPHDNFQKEVQARVNYIAQLPPKSVMESKKLIRDQEREKLHKVNEKETKLLEWKWLSEENLQGVMYFYTKRADKR